MRGEITLLGVVLGLVLGVAGTVLGEVLRLRRRPKLTLALVDGLTLTEVAPNNAAFARLDVLNAPRRDGAVGVSVKIERVRSRSGESASELDFFQGWQLAWANEDRGNPNVPPEARSIPAGGSRRIDLVHLNETIKGKMLVDIRPQPVPRSGANRLGAGTFTFELVVSGDNASARRFAIDVVHDGEQWDGQDASAAERLRLAALRAP